MFSGDGCLGILDYGPILDASVRGLENGLLLVGPPKSALSKASKGIPKLLDRPHQLGILPSSCLVRNVCRCCVYTRGHRNIGLPKGSWLVLNCWTTQFSPSLLIFFSVIKNIWATHRSNILQCHAFLSPAQDMNEDKEALDSVPILDTLANLYTAIFQHGGSRNHWGYPTWNILGLQVSPQVSEGGDLKKKPEMFAKQCKEMKQAGKLDELREKFWAGEGLWAKVNWGISVEPAMNIQEHFLKFSSVFFVTIKCLCTPHNPFKVFEHDASVSRVAELSFFRDGYNQQPLMAFNRSTSMTVNSCWLIWLGVSNMVWFLWIAL